MPHVASFYALIQLLSFETWLIRKILTTLLSVLEYFPAFQAIILKLR